MKKEPYKPVVPEQLDDINFIDSSLQNCPYHAYRMLRDEAPAWIDPLTGFYVISRLDYLRALLTHSKRYSNDMRSDQGTSR